MMPGPTTTIVKVLDRGPNSELAGLVKAWRHRLTRDAGLPSARYRRRRANVTQGELADAVGVSVVWYSNLERGVRANYSDSFLDAVAAALRLGGDERTLLYLLAVGRAPMTLPVAVATIAPEKSLHHFVHGQLWPAYVLNRYAEVVLHNEPCELYYPWLRDHSSYARWLLTSADARQRLVNWEADWAAPLLAQLRISRAQHTRDARIGALIDACLSASPDARLLWNAPANHEYPPRSRRGIRFPGDQRATTVDIVTLNLPKSSELQVVALLPAAEALSARTTGHR